MYFYDVTIPNGFAYSNICIKKKLRIFPTTHFSCMKIVQLLWKIMTLNALIILQYIVFTIFTYFSFEIDFLKKKKVKNIF